MSLNRRAVALLLAGGGGLLVQQGGLGGLTASFGLAPGALALLGLALSALALRLVFPARRKGSLGVVLVGLGCLLALVLAVAGYRRAVGLRPGFYAGRGGPPGCSLFAVRGIEHGQLLGECALAEFKGDVGYLLEPMWDGSFRVFSPSRHADVGWARPGRDGVVIWWRGSMWSVDYQMLSSPGAAERAVGASCAEDWLAFRWPCQRSGQDLLFDAAQRKALLLSREQDGPVAEARLTQLTVTTRYTGDAIQCDLSFDIAPPLAGIESARLSRSVSLQLHRQEPSPPWPVILSSPAESDGSAEHIVPGCGPERRLPR